MSKGPVFFSESIRTAARALLSSGFPTDNTVVIRDLHGRIRIAIDMDKKDNEAAAEGLSAALNELGGYASLIEPKVLFRSDLIDSSIVFSNPELLDLELPEIEASIRVLDRQLIGQDWLLPKPPGATPRLVFFGLKGGVGRSTALTILAHHLAKMGKRVLLIDLDLESPGLSSLLLPLESSADYGLVDWFVEDGVGQAEHILHKLVSASPMGQATQGAIRVAAALGQETNDGDYLAKLSRAYSDINKNGQVEKFSSRVHRLVESLEALEKPDVVLIDSRAGLHDLAAISIVGLSTFAYLFGTGSVQNWKGYRLLFSHWRNYPHTLNHIRERFVVVQSMFPKIDQKARAEKFLEDSYSLFSDTIYEKIEPGSESNPDVFNFDLKNEGAPHYPVRIGWDESFQEFDPLSLAKSMISDAQIDATFGEFLKRVDQDLDGLGDGIN